MHDNPPEPHAPRYVVRPLVIIVTPVAMVVAFIVVLIRDIGRAFRYAWLEALIELDSAKGYWRR